MSRRRTRGAWLAIPALLLALGGCGGEDVEGCGALRRSAPDQAMAHCDRALGNRMVLGERRALVLLDRGALHADRRNWEAALKDTNSSILTGKLPERTLPYAYYDRGTAHMRRGMLEEAIADFDEALRRNPGFTDAHVNRAATRRARGDVKGAIADADTALRLNPRLAKALVQRGVALLTAGELDRAQADLAEAVKLEPGLPAARHLNGLVLRARGNLEGAIAEYGEAIRLDPGIAEAWRARAEAWLQKQDLDRALADLEASLKIEPSNAEAWAARGRIHFNRKDYDRAHQEMDEAVKRAPKNAPLAAERALVFAAKGDFDAALRESERAVALAPQSAAAWFGRGLIDRQRKDMDAALSAFAKAVALDERHLPARANRAMILVDRGEHAKALEDIEAIARISPANADHRMAGLLHYYLGNYPRSAEALARALAAKPGDHYSALLRFLALSHTGPAKAAMEDLAQSARRLPPGVWPARVVEHYLGKAPDAAVYAAANDPEASKKAEQTCEANFYVGMGKVVRGQAAAGIPLLRKSAADCPAGFVERTASALELQRLAK